MLHWCEYELLIRIGLIIVVLVVVLVVLVVAVVIVAADVVCVLVGFLFLLLLFFLLFFLFFTSGVNGSLRLTSGVLVFELNICNENHVFKFKCEVGAQLNRSHALKEVQMMRA